MTLAKDPKISEVLNESSNKKKTTCLLGTGSLLRYETNEAYLLTETVNSDTLLALSVAVTIKSVLVLTTPVSCRLNIPSWPTVRC